MVFMFRSEKDGGVLAFTDDRDGGNLPADLAPWVPLGGNALPIGDGVGDALGGVDAVLDGISRDGFFLVQTTMHTTRYDRPHRLQ